MAHKDRGMKQFRVWLKPDTVKQVKYLALILGRDDEWNIVLDDMVRIGVAYANSAGKLELADWDPNLKLIDLKDDLGLRVFRGELPQLGDN